MREQVHFNLGLGWMSLPAERLRASINRDPFRIEQIKSNWNGFKRGHKPALFEHIFCQKAPRIRASKALFLNKMPPNKPPKSALPVPNWRACFSIVPAYRPGRALYVDKTSHRMNVRGWRRSIHSLPQLSFQIFRKMSLNPIERTLVP